MFELLQNLVITLELNLKKPVVWHLDFPQSDNALCACRCNFAAWLSTGGDKYRCRLAARAVTAGEGGLRYSWRFDFNF